MKSPLATAGESVTPQVPLMERAIISVSDKTGLTEFASELCSLGIEIYSTGGTRAFLQEQGLAARDIAEYTRFPEMMGGRVKTLHPKVFGGILWRRDCEEDQRAAAGEGMVRFDLVVVNLYPFEQTISLPSVTESAAIENIDIGGPSLVRAAAKNSAFVTVATSPTQYPLIVQQLREHGNTTADLRRRLMVEAFEHTAHYDRVIADYFGTTPAQPLPSTVDLRLRKLADLRYGENSHQAGAVYRVEQDGGFDLVGAEQLHGKQLSYNNYLDLDAALNLVSKIGRPACAVIKHTNPCGAATRETLSDAARAAFAGDPVSAFGSVVGCNRVLDVSTAEFLVGGDLFVEAIVAPDFQGQAVEILTTRPKWKTNVRLIRCPLNSAEGQPRMTWRQIHGGVLVQQADEHVDSTADWTVATADAIDESVAADLEFAWHVVRFVKSNAIVLACDTAICGVGAGQMSRVDAVKIAIAKAGPRAPGSVLASDAFFPFADSIHLAAEAGIRAIIQPGGSVKDSEVIEACRRAGMPLVLTGRRHFLH